MALGGTGTQTAALASGGSSGPSTTVTAITETYDGTAWATNPSMGTARYYLAGGASGTTSAALVMGGANAAETKQNATEEFTGETTALNVKTLTQA